MARKIFAHNLVLGASNATAFGAEGPAYEPGFGEWFDWNWVN